MRVPATQPLRPSPAGRVGPGEREGVRDPANSLSHRRKHRGKPENKKGRAVLGSSQRAQQREPRVAQVVPPPGVVVARGVVGERLGAPFARW